MTSFTLFNFYQRKFYASYIRKGVVLWRSNFLVQPDIQKYQRTSSGKKQDSNDDYILDVFEFCKQDPDGGVWVPNVEKYFELLNAKFEWEIKEAF